MPVKSQWTGQYAVTREMLLTMLEQAFTDSEDLSVPERALLTACEFWAAVESGSLRQFLGASAAQKLRYISIVYAAIGACDVAQVLDETLAALTQSDNGHSRWRCIATLQRRLRQSDDPLIDLVARTTQRLH